MARMTPSDTIDDRGAGIGQQVAGIHDPFGINALLQGSQQGNAAFSQVVMQIIFAQSSRTMVVGNAATRLCGRGERLIPAGKVERFHVGNVGWHAGEGEVQINP